MNTIFEVLEYGAIVAQDDALELLITWNASYYNLWVSIGEGYECTDCYCTEDQAEQRDIDIIMNRAEAYLDRVRSEGEGE